MASYVESWIMGLPIHSHSQFGRVSRCEFEFVARLSEPTVNEISHLWRIYHETGGGRNTLDFSPNAVIAVPSVVRKWWGSMASSCVQGEVDGASDAIMAYLL